MSLHNTNLLFVPTAAFQNFPPISAQQSSAGLRPLDADWLGARRPVNHALVGWVARAGALFVACAATWENHAPCLVTVGARQTQLLCKQGSDKTVVHTI